MASDKHLVGAPTPGLDPRGQMHRPHLLPGLLSVCDALVVGSPALSTHTGVTRAPSEAAPADFGELLLREGPPQPQARFATSPPAGQLCPCGRTDQLTPSSWRGLPPTPSGFPSAYTFTRLATLASPPPMSARVHAAKLRWITVAPWPDAPGLSGLPAPPSIPERILLLEAPHGRAAELHPPTLSPLCHPGCLATAAVDLELGVSQKSSFSELSAHPFVLPLWRFIPSSQPHEFSDWFLKRL